MAASNFQQERFVADSMMGKLAKWLRIMGYDTLYQSYYRPGALDQLLKEGRRLLTRHEKRADHYREAILLRPNRVAEQLAELKKRLPLRPDPSRWFSRCLICNALLKHAALEEARENVPEYVFYRNIHSIRVCPRCGRYYWPGTHRMRMIQQLEQWGFSSLTHPEAFRE